MRINKYLAMQKYCTRREADALIERGRVSINGRRAQLGDKVVEGDRVEVQGRAKHYRYIAYHKPRGVITHSPQYGEKDIASAAAIPGVFPVGRLDKDSHGLIILTDDGRVTERLLSPESGHEKHYVVTTAEKLRPSFREHMERGVDIGGYVTKPCRVRILGDKRFEIVLTEGKKHQIKRMCVALHSDVVDLRRTQIANVKLGPLAEGAHRALQGAELAAFLKTLGL